MNPLYTIGYQTIRDAAQLAAAVKAKDVRLADIRIKPWSPNPRWQLASLRNAIGPDHYTHVGDLGNRNYKGEYGDGVLLVNEAAGVAWVSAILTKQPVMLMCACREVTTCHRSHVATLVQQRTGCEVIHLTGSDLSAWLPPTEQQLTFL